MHRPHRHLHRKGSKERQPQPGLRIPTKFGLQQDSDICRSGFLEHEDHCDQHQHRAQQGVEEEFHRRINTVGSTPDTDHQKHRDQATFKEDVEHHQIERGEHADHHRFQQQEGDHVVGDAFLDCARSQNTDRHQGRGQHDKQDRNPVHAHAIAQTDTFQPGHFMDKLEAGIGAVEISEHEQRTNQRNHGRRQSHMP